MITSDDTTQALINTGIDTPEKLNAFIAQLSLQALVKQIDIQIDSLNTKSSDALAPIENQRIDLRNQRAALLAQLVK